MNGQPERMGMFFVIMRNTGQWSVGTRIVSVHALEADAESEALRLRKTAVSDQTFGVAMLRSEARPVAEPIETVRVYPTDDPR